MTVRRAHAMTADQIRLRASALLALALLAALVVFALTALALVSAALAPEARATLATALAPEVAALVMVALVVVVLATALAQPLLRRWLLAPALLRDEAMLLLQGPLPRPLAAAGGNAALQGLARCIAELARQRRRLFQQGQPARVALAVENNPQPIERQGFRVRRIYEPAQGQARLEQRNSLVDLV